MTKARLKALHAIRSQLEDMKVEIDELSLAERDQFGALSEARQESDTGQAMETLADACDTFVDAIETFVDEIPSGDD